MNRNFQHKPLYKWEKEAVRLRHYEGLLRTEIAERLGLTFNQVKYIFSKKNVQRYVQKEILPIFWKQEIAELEDKLKDPQSQCKAFAEYLKAEYHARSGIWLGPCKKVYIYTRRSSQRRWRALDQHGRIMGVLDPSHAERNTRKYVLKHAAKLRKRLELLKEKLRQVEEL